MSRTNLIVLAFILVECSPHNGIYLLFLVGSVSCSRFGIYWPKEVMPHLYLSHRLNTKPVIFVLQELFTEFNLLHNIFSKEATISVLYMS